MQEWSTLSRAGTITPAFYPLHLSRTTQTSKSPQATTRPHVRDLPARRLKAQSAHQRSRKSNCSRPSSRLSRPHVVSLSSVRSPSKRVRRKKAEQLSLQPSRQSPHRKKLSKHPLLNRTHLKLRHSLSKRNRDHHLGRPFQNVSRRQLL